MGVAMAVIILVGVVSAYVGTAARPGRPRRSRAPGGCATSCAIVADARDFRWLLIDVRASRRSRPAACSPASTTSPRTCCGKDGAATILFVCFVGAGAAAHPGLGGDRHPDRARSAATLRASLVLAGGAALARDRASVPLAGRGLRCDGAGRRRVRRAARCSRWRCSRTPRRSTPRRTGPQPGRRLHRRLDRRGDARPALGPGVFALVLAIGGYRVLDRRRRSCSRTRR